MISDEQWARLSRREFDTPNTIRKRGTRYMSSSDLRRAYLLADQGLPGAVIAERLGINTATVSYHLSRRAR